jgi:UDP-N-acetylmuramyl-tripeptide synthetase
MKKQTSKKVAFWGCGGEGVYHALLYFYYQKIKCVGYDLNKTKYTKKIEELKVEFLNNNPTDFIDIKQVIYSTAVPKLIVDNAKANNKNTKFVSLDIFYKNLVKDFENNNLNKLQIQAFKKSKIAPLFFINTKNSIFIGVTGTNGKTTTCEMLYNCLQKANKKVCLISTLSAKINKKSIKTGLHTTTPSNKQLASLIKNGQKQGCKYFVIEVTSHGLDMQRLAGLKFDLAVYTNVTREHLDFHKTYANYLKAKSLLITKHLKPTGKTILNKDDKKSFAFLSKIFKNYKTYGTKKGTDYQALNINLKSGKMQFLWEDLQIKLGILGDYNLYNALATISALNELKVSKKSIVNGLKSTTKVAGRMQLLQSKPFNVIVDFAHTPDALEKALKYTQTITKGRLIVVFGCAGGRDAQKRKQMGKIASKWANITILTAEDPRYESLKNINDQIESGFKKGKTSKLIRFDNNNTNVMVRKQAIKKALELAKMHDTVIICGKGHEESMNFKGIEYKWSDITEIKKLLKTI